MVRTTVYGNFQSSVFFTPTPVAGDYQSPVRGLSLIIVRGVNNPALRVVEDGYQPLEFFTLPRIDLLQDCRCCLCTAQIFHPHLGSGRLSIARDINFNMFNRSTKCEYLLFILLNFRAYFLQFKKVIINRQLIKLPYNDK